MFLKNKRVLIVLMMTASLLLTACGGSNESKIIGIWKLENEDDEPTFLEIGEEQIISRQPSNDEPMIADYILTETQSENFILEVINPEDGSKVFLLEGYLDGNDKISVVEAPGEPADLIRVKDMEKETAEHESKVEAAEEEQAKIDEAQRKEDEKQQRAEQKRQEAQTKAEEKERQQKEKHQEDEETAESEKQDRKERAEIERQEKESTEEETAASTENGGLKEEYLEKAFALHQEMNSAATEIYDQGGSPGNGFAGQYHTDWDNMLNEVWGLLEETMPNDEFELLLADQLEWIEEKEYTFENEFHDITASERQRGWDFLSNTTQERTRYLIENYLE